MKTLNNWYIVELAHNVAIGELDGRTFQTRRLIYINQDAKLLMDVTDTYKLGEPDKVWIASKKNFDLQEYIK